MSCRDVGFHHTLLTCDGIEVWGLSQLHTRPIPKSLSTPRQPPNLSPSILEKFQLRADCTGWEFLGMEPHPRTGSRWSEQRCRGRGCEIPALPEELQTFPSIPNIQPVAASRNSERIGKVFTLPGASQHSSCPLPQQGAASLQRQERRGEKKKKIMNINLNSSEFQLDRVRAPQIFEQLHCKQGGGGGKKQICNFNTQIFTRDKS